MLDNYYIDCMYMYMVDLYIVNKIYMHQSIYLPKGAILDVHTILIY